MAAATAITKIIKAIITRDVATVGAAIGEQI